MIVAFVALPICCMLVTLLVVYFKNQWALVATQVLDDIGAGVYDTMLPIILVKKLLQGSVYFGFVFEFIVTMWRIGHGVLLLIGEALFRSFNYMAAFVALRAIETVYLPVFVLFFNIKATSVKCKANKESSERTRDISRTLSILGGEINGLVTVVPRSGVLGRDL